MDDLDLSAPEAETSAKKPRKASVKRPRARSEEVTASPETASAADAVPGQAAEIVSARPKRTRGRRGKAATTDSEGAGEGGATELFGAGAASPSSNAGQADTAPSSVSQDGAPRVYSFAPDDAPEGVSENAQTAVHERPVFVPDSRADAAQSVSSVAEGQPGADVVSEPVSDPAVSPQVGGGEKGGNGPGGRREERK